MRRLALSVALAVSLLPTCAGPALALRRHHDGRGAQNVPVVRATGFSASEAADNVTGHVRLERMAPNTTYTITVFESPAVTASWTPIVAGTLTTNDLGNGNLAIKVQRIPGSTAFSVAAVP